jgi:hypothetical protein
MLLYMLLVRIMLIVFLAMLHAKIIRTKECTKYVLQEQAAEVRVYLASCGDRLRQLLQRICRMFRTITHFFARLPLGHGGQEHKMLPAPAYVDGGTSWTPLV